jgi:PAS domain S-box-containing protein
MKDSPPAALVDGLSSRWSRAVIRVLSIRGITWLALALALLTTLLACLQAWRWQRDRQRTMFQADAKVLRNALLERLGLYAQVLQGSRGLFAASEEVNAAEFRAYTASLNLGENYPGIVGLGYIEMVKNGQRAMFLQKVAADRSLSRDPLQIWPTGERSDYMVVRFVEPLATNRVALGYDIGSEPVRRLGAIESADSGLPTLTPRIELVQGTGTSGALLFQPLYSQTIGAVSPEDRENRLSGWVYAAFFVERMMAGVRGPGNKWLEYEIFDGTEPSAERLLCSSKGAGASLADSQFKETLSLAVFQRDWMLRIHSSADRTLGPALATVGFLGAGGICMSLLIFGVLHSMATSGRRAVTLAGEMNAELRRREAALETSAERLAMVIEGSNDGVWDWELKTGRVYFSPRWKSMLGYQDDEIENTFDAWESLLHPDDRDRARRALSAYFTGRTTNYQLQQRLQHKDGSYRWILARGVAQRDNEGRAVRMAGSHVDLTELKEGEQRLRRANDELEVSQEQLQGASADLRESHEELEKTRLELIQAAKLESIGTLAAGVAHEINNPLQIMVMGLDHLDRMLDVSDDDTRITLEDMRDATRRADSISKELLHFSKATEFAPTRCSLETLLERSLWLMRCDVAEGRIRLVKNFTRQLPLVLIDASKIQQVFINLIDNAIQAMGRSGTLVITTDCGPLEQMLPADEHGTLPRLASDQAVRVRIKDSGPGIPENRLPRIFDPFYTTKKVGTGSGLGLSVSRKIVDLHGALIDIRNSPSGGLEALLIFAAAPAPSAVPPVDPVPAAEPDPTRTD